MVFPTDSTKVEIQIRGEAPNQILDLHVPRGERGETGPQGPRGPKVQVSVGDVMMGPAAPGTVGPQGLTGPKGDPGGIVLGTLLGTSDLNSIVTSGVYRQTNSSGADSPLTKNYPYQGGYGTLIVYETTQNATSDVVQEFRSQHYAGAIDARGFWRRNRSNNVWSPWRHFPSQRVDQTAGRAIYTWDDVNGREQLIYGDTGWRDMWSVVTAIDPAATKEPGFLGARIRRTLQHVHLDIGFVTSLNPGTQDWRAAILPSSNWYPDMPINWQIPASVTGSAGVIHFSPNNYVRAWTAGKVILQMTLPCSAPWPTTLPGVASGTIPNT